MPTTVSKLLQNRQHRIRGNEQAALGHAFRSAMHERAAQFLRCQTVAEEIFEGAADSNHLHRRLMDKFQPEMPDSRIEPAPKMPAGFLGLGSENRIAAADVGDQRVRPSAGVAQRDLVMLAGPAAVTITGSG